jgi:3-oxoadipate enol-lactonase
MRFEPSATVSAALDRPGPLPGPGPSLFTVGYQVERMETVTHNGRETAYRVSDRGGDRTPVLFVHGSGGSHGVWKGQFRLSDDRPVAALDLSGHGASEDVDADPGWPALSAYADDVLAVADAVDAGVLAGNSLGGAVVLHAAVERDVDPDAMVLVGTGARLAVLEDLLSWLDDDFERAMAFLHAPDRLFHDPDEELVALSRTAMAEAGQAVTARDFRTCHRFDVREDLGEVDAPALALTGDHDELTPPWYHEFLADELPDSEWTTLPDVAHLSMLEDPAAFNDAVASFLAGRGL